MPKVVYLDSMLDVASSQVVIAVGTGGEGAVWHLC